MSRRPDSISAPTSRYRKKPERNCTNFWHSFSTGCRAELMSRTLEFILSGDERLKPSNPPATDPELRGIAGECIAENIDEDKTATEMPSTCRGIRSIITTATAAPLPPGQLERRFLRRKGSRFKGILFGIHPRRTKLKERK
ncbi:hypothetical protein NPIL_56171 [Nephila pilipes]|uniref:Uncharacterized protein n=1 Tax=Nephila pilipes TaxID=299642 RepID=A0A8X6NZG6_NEPPI|nr:hypothetical protein NPIL_56171 [Nephila pilipes]